MMKKQIHHIRCSIHCENQKFLPKPNNRIDRNFDIYAGLDLSLIENKVLFALQKLLWLCHIEGKCFWNPFPAELTGYHFSLELPRIYEFKKVDLFKAYGLQQHEAGKLKRQKQYSSNQMAQVWKAFERFANEDFYLKYTCKELDPKTGEQHSNVKLEKPLIIFNQEGKFLDFGMVMAHELRNYGLPKPFDYLDKAEMALEEMGIHKASKYHIRFLEWFMLRAWQNQGRKLLITREQLVYTLRMYDKYWKTGKKRLAENLIGQAIQMTESMGYLKNSSEYGGKYGGCFEFTPNNDVLRPKKEGKKGAPSTGWGMPG